MIPVHKPVKFFRAGGEAKDRLAGVKGITLAGDHARLDKLHHTVVEHLRMDTKVFKIMLYQQFADNAGDSAHAKLDSSPAFYLLRQQRSDGFVLPSNNSRWKLGNLIFVVLNDIVHLRDINNLIIAPEDPWHVLVDLKDDLFGYLAGCFLTRHRRAEIKVAFLVHRCDFNKGDIHHVLEPLAVHAGSLAESEGDIGAGAVLVIFPLHPAEEPGVMNEMLLEGVMAGDNGMRMLGADFNVLQLFGAGGQFFINQRRKAADSTVVNPHAGLDQSGGFLGRDKLAPVFMGVVFYRHCLSSISLILSIRFWCRPPSNSVLRKSSTITLTFPSPSSAARQQI